MAHHASEMSPALIEQLRELGIGPTGEYPHGKSDPSDEGEIKIAVAADRKAGIVRLAFGKPVAWVGLTPEQAAEIADTLTKKAWELRGIT